jgi:hypothetical protein
MLNIKELNDEMEPEFRNIIPELFREWKREDSQNRL